MRFKEFCYNSLEEVVEDCARLGLKLDFSDNLQLLGKDVTVGKMNAPNSLAFHPMEGCDGRLDGAPGELTVRRYERLSKGGAGLLWFEAVAVKHEGRAYPRQLWINEDNLSEYQELFDMIMSNYSKEFGYTPICIMQLTHSGRFSKPEGKPAPVIAARNPYLDRVAGIEGDYPVISDDQLEMLEDEFVAAAVLAEKAGFHGVDIKCCHRYLNSELLSACTRDGRYGGSFEGRTRFLLNVADKIRNRLGRNFIVATRINIYDGIPYPYGWGVDRDDAGKPDYEEPVRLVEELKARDVRLINMTMGTPYYNPHVNRPYDKGGYIPPEHPLEGIARLVNGIGHIQKSVDGIMAVGTGFSWLRHFSPFLAAGMLENGAAAFIGYGRESFAYPAFARDILQNGTMRKEKCCIACGKCTQIMRAGGTAGCVIRDPEIYAEQYKTLCKT